MRIRIRPTVRQPLTGAPAETGPTLPALERAEPAPSRSRRARCSPLERVMEPIGDPYAFISQYAHLDASWRGHCPFHPPDRHPSLAVNRNAGHWVEFLAVKPRTGRYVGGGATEFYRRLRGLSYIEVNKEMGEPLPNVAARPSKRTRYRPICPETPS